MLMLHLFLGNSASDVNFQAYLVGGLAIWNDDRTTTQKDSGPRSWDYRLRFALNSMRRKMLGTDTFPSTRSLCADTGEWHVLLCSSDKSWMFLLILNALPMQTNARTSIA